MANGKLSKADWTDAGFTALVKHGPSAVKVEPLARSIGATKGSFYWHFKDLPALHDAMLNTWEQRAIAALDPDYAEQKPAAALRRFAQDAAATQGEASIEPAMRAWASEAPKVAQALKRIENARMIFLSELLRACGVSNSELSRALYAAAIGMQDLSARDGKQNEDAMGTLVDLILALR